METFDKRDVNLKTTLLLHGWPQYIEPDHPISILFNELGYNVVAPKLFEHKYTITNIKSIIKRELKNKSPNVIVGVSQGGMLAQIIALTYPNSKLILVATGPYLKPKFNLFFKFLFYSRLTDLIYLFLKIMPRSIIFPFYKLTNFINGSNFKDYESVMNQNIKTIKLIKYHIYRQVFNFVLKTNNVKILNKIINNTLILGGKKDMLMPIELSNIMNQEIKNSTLTIFDEPHYKVITNTNSLDKIKKFV